MPINHSHRTAQSSCDFLGDWENHQRPYRVVVGHASLGWGQVALEGSNVSGCWDNGRIGGVVALGYRLWNSKLNGAGSARGRPEKWCCPCEGCASQELLRQGPIAVLEWGMRGSSTWPQEVTGPRNTWLILINSLAFYYSPAQDQPVLKEAFRYILFPSPQPSHSRSHCFVIYLWVIFEATSLIALTYSLQAEYMGSLCFYFCVCLNIAAKQSSDGFRYRSMETHSIVAFQSFLTILYIIWTSSKIVPCQKEIRKIKLRSITYILCRS